ncbi:MAG: hypothetical protein KC546_21970, partial [Anaerolineae bacterium]|nr:hypothetical protein [Anaerolineae bacterium]
LICDSNAREAERQLSWWQIETDTGLIGWIPGRVNNEPQMVLYDEEHALSSEVCQMTTIGTVNIRRRPTTLAERVSVRAGGNQTLAASAQYGNPAVEWEHWWQLIEGYWVRADTVLEEEACISLPYAELP